MTFHTDFVIRDLEEDKLSCTERIKEPQRHRGYHRAEKADVCEVREIANYQRSRKIPSPHNLEALISERASFKYQITNLRREEIGHFFQTKENATNGRSERHCNSCGTCSTEDLTSFACDIFRSTKEAN